MVLGPCLLSKYGPLTEARTRDWLAAEDFYNSTGLPPDAARFCRRRPDKAGICTELGITHFVDDRLEVLSYLHDVPHRHLFMPKFDEVNAHRHALAHVTTVHSWGDLLHAVAPGRANYDRHNLDCSTEVGPATAVAPGPTTSIRTTAGVNGRQRP